MEEKLAQYTSFRIDDTVEWKLVIFISDTGMCAYLKNIENPLEGVLELFVEKWDRDDSQLLSRIENGIYNHPQVLDDFATDILICTDKLLWMPKKVAEDESEMVRQYNMVFAEEEDNILSEANESVCCVYSSAAGLPGFLRRTLPGARVQSHLMVLYNKFRKTINDEPTLYVDISEDEADYLLIESGKLLMGSTHSWHNPMDIGYMVMNVFKVYGVNPKSATVSISGNFTDKQELVKIMREQIAYVMFTKIPTVVSKISMPLSAALSLMRN